MAVASTAGDLVFKTVLDMIGGMVSNDVADLSARQLGIFLVCYREPGEHTVRGLAARFNISKPAVTRALDRLADLNLTRRKIDPKDRRSVFVVRTSAGAMFIRQLRSWAAPLDVDSSRAVNVVDAKVEAEVVETVKQPARRQKEIPGISALQKGARPKRVRGVEAVKVERRRSWH